MILLGREGCFCVRIRAKAVTKVQRAQPQIAVKREEAAEVISVDWGEPIETALLTPTFEEEAAAEQQPLVFEPWVSEEPAEATETPEQMVVEPQVVIIETPEPSAPEPVCEGKPYTVRRGDSFQLIARRFGVTMRDLLAANPELHPGRLMVGDVLCIPQAEQPVPVPAPAPVPVPVPPTEPAPARTGPMQFQVREGQSIVDILLEGNVSLNAVQAANPRLRFGQQRVGEWVRLPPGGTRGSCGSGTPYEIAEQMSLPELANRLGMSVGALLRANAHLLPSDFTVGQVICLPGGTPR